MPTPISGPDKNAVLGIVRVMDINEAADLVTVLVNYEDVVNMIARQVVVFEYYPEYLREIMNCFSNGAALLANGIYFNQSAVAPDPKVIIDSTVTTNISLTVSNDGLGVFTSTLSKITLGTGVILSDLWLTSGTVLSMLDASAANCYVNNIWIRNLKSNPASLLAVAIGSNISQSGIHVDEGAFYGGITNNNPALTCAIPVTALAVSEQTYNSIKLAWTNPASGYVSIIAYYKKSEAPTWLITDITIGDYLPGNTGFIFRTLEKDTNYDFKVVVTCINGGIAETDIVGVTICC